MIDQQACGEESVVGCRVIEGADLLKTANRGPGGRLDVEDGRA
jgi:hypothetical protein